MEEALREALKTMRVKDAARQVAEDLGLPRRDVYQAALTLDDRG
jgi:16S rRNA (cytidine1402-2'-O)-methyltransferase